LRDEMVGRFDPYPVMFERFIGLAGHEFEFETFCVLNNENYRFTTRCLRST
jgi:hypothetical protein